MTRGLTPPLSDQLISQKDRPLVRTAKVYALFGELTESEMAQ